MSNQKLPHEQLPRIVRKHREWVVVPMARYHWYQQNLYLNAKAWCSAQNLKECISGRNH